MSDSPFWQTKSLNELSQSEWESLCDGCGKCCLHKLEDEDTGELFFTNVSCEYLDTEQCECIEYALRQSLVPECLVLNVDKPEVFEWLPSTCAYRLLFEGQALFDWHPLVSGDKNSVHAAGMSVKGRVISEAYIHPDEFEEHIIRWVN